MICLSVLYLEKYFIEHDLRYPSKVSDYDYDPNNLNRRFVTTYIHYLIFKDTITNIEILSLKFTSEICARIISVLYQLSFDIEDTSNSTTVISINDIFIDGKNLPSTIIVSKVGNNVNISLAKSHETISISLNAIEVQEFISLLERDEILDMYVVDSDEWRFYFENMFSYSYFY